MNLAAAHTDASSYPRFVKRMWLMGLGRKQNSKTDLKIKSSHTLKQMRRCQTHGRIFLWPDCKNEQMGIVQIADKQGTDERINMSITDVMYWLDKMQEKTG